MNRQGGENEHVEISRAVDWTNLVGHRHRHGVWADDGRSGLFERAERIHRQSSVDLSHGSSRTPRGRGHHQCAQRVGVRLARDCTMLGWLLVLRGIMLLVFPLTVQVFGDRVATSQAGVTAGAALTFVLGAILCMMGYEHLWASKPRRAARAASARTRRSRRPRRKRA